MFDYYRLYGLVSLIREPLFVSEFYFAGTRMRFMGMLESRLPMMKSAPMIPENSIVSPKNMVLRNTADNGETAQKSSARLASMYFWATGWRVKPMTKQKRVRMRTQNQVDVLPGRAGVSIKKAAGMEKSLMNPFGRMPRARASSSLAARSVMRIAAA